MRRRTTLENSTKNSTEKASPVKESRNINVRAAFIHAIGDFIQSIGVLIAAYIIKYKVSLGCWDGVVVENFVDYVSFVFIWASQIMSKVSVSPR